MRLDSRVLALAALLLLPAARVAVASPLETSGGNAVFTGPASPHPSSIFLNPAALGLARPGQHFYLGGDLRIDSFDISRQSFDPQTGGFGAGAGVQVSTFSPGAMAAFYTSVADRGFFGVAVHTPFWEEFIAGKEALGYHVLGGRTWQTLLSLAGAYRASSRVHFGLGLSVGFSRLELDLLRDTALEAGSGAARGLASDCGGAPCGVENPQAAQTYRVEVGTPGLAGLFAAKNLSLSVGLAIRPAGQWWIGISYVSPPGAITSLDLEGKVDHTAAPRDGGQTVRGDAEITYRMPASVLVGARGPLFGSYELTTSLRWQNFARQDQLDIRFFGRELEQSIDVPEWYPRDRGLKDVYRIQAGLEGADGEPLRLGGRLHFETGASDDAKTTPLQIYGPSLGIAGGVEVRITQNFAVAGGYDLSWFPEIGTGQSAFDPRDRINCVDSGFEFTACTAAREGRATPTAAGEYNRLQHAFSLSIRYDRF